MDALHFDMIPLLGQRAYGLSSSPRAGADLHEGFVSAILVSFVALPMVVDRKIETKASGSDEIKNLRFIVD